MMGDFGSYSSYLSAYASPFTVDRLAEKPSPTGFEDFFTASVSSHSVHCLPNTKMWNPEPFSFPELQEMALCGPHRVPHVQPVYVSSELDKSETPGFPGYYGSKEKHQAGGTSVRENSIGLGLDGYDVSSKADSCGKIFALKDLEERMFTFAATGQDNEKCFTVKCPDFMSAYNSKSSVFRSASKFPENYPREMFFQSIDPWNNGVSGTCFKDKFQKQHGVCLDDPTTMKTRMNPEINTPILVAPLPSSTSERKVRFDPTQIRVHLGGDDISIPRNILTGNDLPGNRSVCNGAFENLFGAESNLHGLAPGCDETTNHIKNSFESLDHYSPTVDSPCWKGALFSHSSPFEVSKPVSGNDAAKNFSKNSSGCSLSDSYGFLDSILASPSVEPSSPSLLSQGCESCDGEKAESGNKKSLDDFNQPSDKDVPLVKSINEPDTKLCTISEQGFVEDALFVSENKSETGCGTSNPTFDASDVSDFDSSHGPFIATTNSSSQYRKKVDPVMHSNLHDDGLLPPKINVNSLVNAMHNLSELLLYECFNKRSKLKEEEQETLSNMMSNLGKCIMKTTGQMPKTGQASISQQALTQSFSNLVMHHEDKREIDSQVEEITDSLGPFFNKHAMEEGENLCDGYHDAETSKDDKTTQSIRHLLAWNFPDEEEIHPQVRLFKNLWLDAEAVLCSTTCIARFNRIKNEIERYKLPTKQGNSIDINSHPREESFPRSTCLKPEPVLSIGQTTEFPIRNSPIIGVRSYEKDVMARLHILKCRDLLSESVDATAVDKESFSVTHDTATDKKSASNAVSDNVPDICCVQDSPNVDASSRVNDVMDRFQTLKSQVYEHKSENTLDSKKVGQPLFEENCSQMPEMSVWDSQAITIGSSPNDLEASVMASFCVLKSRVGDCSAPENKGDEILNANLQPVSPHTNVMSSHWIIVHGNEISTRGCESSSDWEHVLKDELAGQNCCDQLSPKRTTSI